MKAIFLILSLLFASFLFSQQTETFNSGSGTWIVPAGVCVVKVEAWGGGGKGGNNNGGGGGGGGYCVEDISVTPGAMIDWLVGLGGGAGSGSGSGASSGSGGGGGISGNGGLTSFGSSVIAYGGFGGGNGSPSGSGGAGGAGGIGCDGSDGDDGNGGSGNKAGGKAGGVDGGAGGTSGGPGVVPGGGGAGASGTGGLGAEGKIILTYFLSIYNVNKNQYYCNLADALAGASEGDEFHIPSATYMDPCVVINKSIKFTALGGPVIIDCIEMNGPNKEMTLGSNFTFNTLNLTIGNVSTNGFNLMCGTITGGGPSSYVITD